MESGFTGVDPTTGETDLREMASTIDLGTGEFTSRTHEFSDGSATQHFVCIHTAQRIPDWTSCMTLAQPARCMCLGFWFVPPRDAFECN
jgi:hypothetical protein